MNSDSLFTFPALPCFVDRGVGFDVVPRYVVTRGTSDVCITVGRVTFVCNGTLLSRGTNG